MSSTAKAERCRAQGRRVIDPAVIPKRRCACCRTTPPRSTFKGGAEKATVPRRPVRRICRECESRPREPICVLRRKSCETRALSAPPLAVTLYKTDYEFSLRFLKLTRIPSPLMASPPRSGFLIPEQGAKARAWPAPSLDRRDPARSLHPPHRAAAQRPRSCSARRSSLPNVSRRSEQRNHVGRRASTTHTATSRNVRDMPIAEN